jgi:hypothetical protein
VNNEALAEEGAASTTDPTESFRLRTGGLPFPDFSWSNNLEFLPRDFAPALAKLRPSV